MAMAKRTAAAPRDEDFEQFVDDQRRQAADVLRSLLLFEQQPLKEPEAWDWKQIQNNLLRVQSCATDTAGVWLEYMFDTVRPPRRRKLTKQQTRAFHAQLRDCLDSLFRNDTTDYLGKRWFSSASVKTQGVVREYGRVHRLYLVDERHSLWTGVLGLLERFGADIRQCEACPMLFLRARRQRYCSARCSQRSRFKAWYAGENREAVLEKRRAKYAKQQKARHGPNVKITGRKRP